VLVDLAVSPLDADAGVLRLRVGDPSPLPPLYRVTIDRYVIDVLGGSHRITVPSMDFCEEVSCSSAVTGEHLPSLHHAPRSSFTSHTAHLTASAFTARVARLIRRLSSNDRAVVARFPGHRFAVTAIAVHQRGGWSTWHCYPSTSEIVTTRTRLVPGP
jgi:hypothetical protein